MRIVHIDATAGAAGDMLFAALHDRGSTTLLRELVRVGRSLRDVAEAPNLPRGSKVERGNLTRAEWPCVECGGLLRRGDPIRVTITPGGGPNRVAHDPVCPTKPKRSR